MLAHVLKKTSCCRPCKSCRSLQFVLVCSEIMQMSLLSWLFTRWVVIQPSHAKGLNQPTLKAITGNADFSINWLNPLEHEISKDSIWNALLLLLLLWLLEVGCYQNILDGTQIQDTSWSEERMSLKDNTMSKGINIAQVFYNFMIIFG